MIVDYYLPSSILKSHISAELIETLQNREVNDHSIDDVSSLLKNYKEKDSNAYNIILGNMLLIYFEVAISKEMFGKKIPKVYDDEDNAKIEDFLDDVDSYDHLSEADFPGEDIIFMLLLASISYNQMDIDEKDQVNETFRNEYPKFSQAFNPNEEIDKLILKIKKKVSFEENFEKSIARMFIKLKDSGCSYNLVIQNVCRLLDEFSDSYTAVQYEKGLKDIIIKYYVFMKSLIDLGNEINLNDQRLVDCIENKNNSDREVLNYVFRSDNRQYIINGFICYKLYTGHHFNNQIDTLDKMNGYSKQMKKRFNF